MTLLSYAGIATIFITHIPTQCVTMHPFDSISRAAQTKTDGILGSERKVKATKPKVSKTVF